jgi:hypothetical protein
MNDPILYSLYLSRNKKGSKKSDKIDRDGILLCDGKKVFISNMTDLVSAMIDY